MNYNLNHTYLVKYRIGNILSSVTMLRISNTAYHVRWNNDNSNTQWMLKKEFEKDYRYIEDITDFIIENPDTQLKINFPEYLPPPIPTTTQGWTEWETCQYCGGTGMITSDGQTTSTHQVCPLCLGNKMVVKKTTVRG